MGIFDFLIQKSDGTMVDYAEILSQNYAKLNASKFAMEKCISMIARAVAKSEIILQDKSGMIRDGKYYRLNVKPNDNEAGTEFWQHIVQKMLVCEGECLVIPLNDKYYIAQSWTTDDNVLRSRKYSAITLETPNGNDISTLLLNKTFKADDVLHFRHYSRRLQEYFISVANLYDQTVSAAAAAFNMSNSKKFKVKYDAQMSFVDRDTGKKITGKDYAEKIKDLINSPDISMIILPDGVEVEQMKIESGISASDIETITKAAEMACARAFDIPESIYFGTIQDKADATNLFLTYAVDPVVEEINDEMNAKLVGEEDYTNGERIMVWTSRFKHKDVLDSANSIDKLRADGFTLDEIFHMIGYPELGTEFTTTRALTKNYTTADLSAGSAGNV